MARKSRKIGRLAAGKIFRVVPVDDTEKLMASSMNSDTKSINADPAHKYSHSQPELSPNGHDYNAHEITNVPAPIPDTGSPPLSADPDEDQSIPPTGQAAVALKTSAGRSHPSKSTFVPLPSLKTLNLTEIEAAAQSSSTVYPMSATDKHVAITPTGSSAHDPSLQSNTSHTAIALAVSGVLTLFVLVVIVKLIKRPRRRKTPTPSLPILRDGAFPDKTESEESPVFGGKECSSPTLQARNAKGDIGPWTWTQYHSGIPKPGPIVTVTRSSSKDRSLTVNETAQECSRADSNTTRTQGDSNQGQYLFVGHGNPNAISKTKNVAPLQPVQNAITRAVSRLSTVSMSLYPNSPGGYSQVGADVGVAIDGVLHEELGNAAVARHKDRMMASHNRTSMIAPGSAKDAAALRRSQSFAYGGMEFNSSPTASPARGQLNGGRTRIKSTYYAPGSYPRGSAAATNYRKLDRDHEQDGTGSRGDGVNSRRGRDLTSALGLTSPIPPSPQPTLYPDDSMSVIGEAKRVTLAGRSHKKPVPNAISHFDSPPPDSAALGSLMMVDFATSKSTASLVNIRPCEAARAREGDVSGKSNLKKRVEDRPPRVPSPPPIPSLAQMAMQHADPEGYADYHSPTYSIYGLYDGDRKSRGLSYGYS